jgi:hypothetical protein
MRFTHPDSSANRQWSVKAGVTHEELGDPVFSCSVYVDTAEANAAAIHRPRLVSDVVNAFWCGGHPRLRSTPDWIASPADVAHFQHEAGNSERLHPAVLITPDSWTGHFAAGNPSSIAATVAGVAHVYVADTPQVAKSVNGGLFKRLKSEADGVAIYWPVADGEDDSPSDRLWSSREILALMDSDRLSFGQELLRSILAESMKSGQISTAFQVKL